MSSPEQCRARRINRSPEQREQELAEARAWKQLEKIPMSLSMSTLISLLNWGGQAALQLSGLITSTKGRAVAVGVSVIIAQILKLIAAFSNPDGTPAETQWQGGFTKANVPKLPIILLVLIFGSAAISQAQVGYTLAAGATGFLSSTPHSGGIADFGIIPSPTSRFSNITEATVRPISFKSAAFEVLSGVETVVATRNNLELSLLGLVVSIPPPVRLKKPPTRAMKRAKAKKGS